MTAPSHDNRPFAGRIHLARHGKPNLSRRPWITRHGYRAWWAEYGKVDLRADQSPPDRLQDLANEAALVIASPIPRALRTAEMLVPKEAIEVDKLFEEAPLPAPFILPYLRTPAPIWAFLSRVSWLLGYTDGGESRYEAERRAHQAADRLIQLAADLRGDILLCGHGWFNYMTGKELKRRGWRVTEGGGSGYWDHTSYVAPDLN